jgi:hypothetical protein
METAVFRAKKKNDLQLLIDLAKKIGIQTKPLTEDEVEDMAMLNSIKTGRTVNL